MVQAILPINGKSARMALTSVTSQGQPMRPTPLAALSATTYYQVVVSASASGCDDVTSATATVTVIPDIVITADPTDDTICEGGTSSLSVSITGGAGTITYQWQISTDGTNFSDISGATNATYTTEALTADYLLPSTGRSKCEWL